MDNRAMKHFYDRFPGDEACRAYLEQMKWPDGPVCPHCSSIAGYYRFQDKKTLKCKGCRRQFSVTAGTIFADSHIPLRDWFFAVYALSLSDTGLSSTSLAEYIGTTQKSAWSLIKRLRDRIERTPSVQPLREKPYRIRVSFDDALRKLASP
jgi:transposase-like protein